MRILLFPKSWEIVSPFLDGFCIPSQIQISQISRLYAMEASNPLGGTPKLSFVAGISPFSMGIPHNYGTPVLPSKYFYIMDHSSLEISKSVFFDVLSRFLSPLMASIRIISPYSEQEKITCSALPLAPGSRRLLTAPHIGQASYATSHGVERREEYIAIPWWFHGG